jgi:hypothetical protein
MRITTSAAVLHERRIGGVEVLHEIAAIRAVIQMKARLLVRYNEKVWDSSVQVCGKKPQAAELVRLPATADREEQPGIEHGAAHLQVFVELAVVPVVVG